MTALGWLLAIVLGFASMLLALAGAGAYAVALLALALALGNTAALVRLHDRADEGEP